MITSSTGLPDSPLIWDNHVCFPLCTEGTWLDKLERYKTSGVDVVSLNVGFASKRWDEHLDVLSFIRNWLSRRSDRYQLVTSVGDIELAKRDGRLAIVFDVEGMRPVEDRPWLVQTFYELGVRWMLIAYNRANAAGGGCLDAEDQGLTQLGRSIIDEMQRVGMVLCLSHCGPRTAADAISYSNNPVIFSHSNPFACAAHPRNVSDDLVRECCRKGGVIGLNGAGPFLGEDVRLVERLIDHLRYLLDLVGPDHIGLGLDYTLDRSAGDKFRRSNPELVPSGVSLVGPVAAIEPERIPEIVERLQLEKLSQAQIAGILGGNWMRVARTVWK